MRKSDDKAGLEGTRLNIIKVIRDEPAANVILSGKRLKAFSLRSGTRQGCPLPPLLFNTVLESPATSNWIKKEIRHPNWEGRNNSVITCR